MTKQQFLRHTLFSTMRLRGSLHRMAESQIVADMIVRTSENSSRIGDEEDKEKFTDTTDH